MMGGVSIVMPAYNEGAIISRTIKDCYEDVISRFDSGGEIIVVDDCSTDQTWQVLDNLKKGLGCRLKLIRNQKNLGHGPSLLRGLLLAGNEFVFTLDSDYQHVPGEFWKLFQQLGKHQIVTGLRTRRNDPPYRLLLSKAANLTVAHLFGCDLDDMNIPFKLFRRPCLMAILPHVPKDFSVPSILIMAIAFKMGFSVKQLPVTHLPRKTGRCSLPGKRLMLFSLQAFYELFRYRLGRWRKIKPAGQQNG